LIFIDPYNPKIVEAKDFHIEKLLRIVLKEVNNLPAGDLKSFLSEYKVREILSDFPVDLENHHLDWLNSVHGVSPQVWADFIVAKDKVAGDRDSTEIALIGNITTLLDELKPIFKYTGGFARKNAKYSAYDLANSLNIQTCVYCNRIYTKTVINPHKITRPEFDHWFPKSTYPLLALSFYNLIPSCHVCNSSVKSTALMNTDDYLHPYIPENIDLKFSYWIKSLNRYDFKIKRDSGTKEDNTVKAFKIEEIYATHRDEINDLVKLRRLYSVDYLLKLKGLLSSVDSNVSMEEVYRLAFGTHYQEKNYTKRPLSKMKRDILEELGMILK